MASEPISILQAFSVDNSDALQCQAAFLLFLGLLAHREVHMGTDFVTTYTPLPWEDLGIENDYQALDIPESIRSLQEAPLRQYSLSKLTDDLRQDGIDTTEWFNNSETKKSDIGELQSYLTNNLFENPNFLNLAKLVSVSVHHPSPLVQVAAASTCFDVIRDAGKFAGSVLLKGTYAKDAEVRNIAATTLARVVPNHPRIDELTHQESAGSEGEPANTSLIVHGTWARNATWWQPNGNFHDYILNSVDNSLYAGLDRYGWSGGYSNQARALGALDLVDWVNQKGWNTPDLFTHSHGGSVAMLANRAMDIGKLVLLSCPVHKNKYWPDFNRTQKVISIRVHMDLVILADRGGQRFRDPKIQENILPLWFDHSTTHDPNTWVQQNIPAMI